MALVHLFLTLALAAPQGEQDPDPRFTSALSGAEQTALNKAARKWFDARKKYHDENKPKARIRLNKALGKARDKFDSTFRSKAKKTPIKHMGDLLAIFDGVFTYQKQPGTGEMKKIAVKGGQPFWAAAPRGYKPQQRYPSVVLVPSRVDGKWMDVKEHFAATWKGVEGAEDWLFFSPELEPGLELDPAEDTSTEAGDALVFQRIAAVLGMAGAAQRSYHIDRNRLLLDCGRGSSAFGLRLASYFPDRFAGLILRDPLAIGDIRLDSLRGMKVLILANEANKSHADQIAKTLNEFEADSCTVSGAKGEHPYFASGAEVTAWASGVHRDLFRSKVTLAPTNERFRKAYWVFLSVCESVHGAAEDLPFVEVEADRAANRITITARNVSNLELLLNDALVDLDKEFTIVINGKAITEKRQRNFYDTAVRLNDRFDPNYIFTTTYATAVPKATSQAPAGGSGTDGNQAPK